MNISDIFFKVQEDYWSTDRKKDWMKLMDIDHSVLSLANPWLEFMEDGEDSTKWATELNVDMENVCRIFDIQPIPLN